MMLTDDHCYRALLTHDARFDGRFFVGVSSTGIYCRPVCRVRTPKAANCRFFPSAAAAEASGYRPCLRCRPELAPGSLRDDNTPPARLAQAAAYHIGDNLAAAITLADLARRLGVSPRHLRRVFAAVFGVAPVQYAQTQRLLLARQLLRDTSLSVTDIAYAAGFGSLRRMHALFRQRYRTTPGSCRRVSTTATAADFVSVALAYRPPYAWREQLDFLAGRAIPGVETVDGDSYLRTACIKRDGRDYRGWIRISPASEDHTLRVDISAALVPVIATVNARVRHLFDLDCDPAAIAAALGALAAATPGLRLPGAFDGFELAVRAVLGQQISVAGARTLAGRIAARCGTPLETPFSGLTHTFPTAGEWPNDSAALAGIGLTGARARTLQHLARACAAGEIQLEPGTDIESALPQLQALPGIGPWTAQYIAMRALAWPDAFPHTDYGIRKALDESRPQRVLAIAEPWRPWRAYATRYLWQSLADAAPTDFKKEART